MTAAVTGEPVHVIDLDGEEVLAAFAEVMRDWGHAGTAEGLRFPAPGEIRAAAARDPRRSRNRDAAGHWTRLP